MKLQARLNSSILSRGRMLAAGLVLATLGVTSLAARPALAAPTAEYDFRTATTFACGEDIKLRVLFITVNRQSAVVVRTPAGADYLLSLRDPPRGLVQIVWSDGKRKLTWDPGVHITWVEGPKATTLHCGSSRGHQHPGQPPVEAAPDAPAAPDSEHHAHASDV